MLWMADMSGHGAAAGLLSAHLKILLDDLRHLDDPAVLAGRLNQHMYESLRNTDDVQYATAAFLHLKKHRLRAAVAAHPPVLLRRLDATQPADGLAHAQDLLRLESGGRPLGVFSGSRYDEVTVDLAAGTMLLLYTDGVIEAGNADGEEFGLARLEHALRVAEGGAAEVSRQLYDRIAAFQDMNFIDDDVTFLVVEC
jgi:phosphoserine phosphatase RsbU/P